MNEHKLENFLEVRLAQLHDIETSANIVLKISRPNELADQYRELIGKLRHLSKSVEKQDSSHWKIIKRNPSARQDARLPWFNSVRWCLLKANAQSRPAVNSRNLNKIQSAASAIRWEISICIQKLDDVLTSLKSN
jgi:hypothetical protein